jgi:hypothetical protein
LLLCFRIVPINPCWHWGEDFVTLSRFKHNRRPHLPISEHRTSANVLNKWRELWTRCVKSKEKHEIASECSYLTEKNLEICWSHLLHNHIIIM